MFVIVLTLHLFQRVRKKLSSILTIIIFSSPGTNVLGEVLSYPQRRRRRRCRCRCHRRQFQVKVFVF